MERRLASDILDWTFVVLTNRWKIDSSHRQVLLTPLPRLLLRPVRNQVLSSSQTETFNKHQRQLENPTYQLDNPTCQFLTERVDEAVTAGAAAEDVVVVVAVAVRLAAATILHSPSWTSTLSGALPLAYQKQKSTYDQLPQYRRCSRLLFPLLIRCTSRTL